MTLEELPAVGRTPTPLVALAVAGQQLGVQLWVKREDLADDFGAGHKVRKLAHILQDARQKGATVVLSAASVPSGQASGLAVHAPRHGLRAHIVYCGGDQVRPVVPRGNYLLTALAGPDVTWHERRPWDEWPALLDDAAAAERRRGEVPYLVPPGMSGWPGMQGSIELDRELATQLGPDHRPTHLVTAAGSGGTALGIAMGLHEHGFDWTVHGVCIGASPANTAAELDQLRIAAGERWGEAARSLPVALYDGARGVGYADPTEREFDAMRRGVRVYGLLLDSTYVAKTVLGLEQLVAVGTIPQGSRVVLVHTGGAPGFFDDQPALTGWAATELRLFVRASDF